MSDARRFKAWVEMRRKDDLKRQLVESRPEERIIEMPRVKPRTPRTSQMSARQPDRPPDPSPNLHPMWDRWIDSIDAQ